jgi:hypothetical protein
MKVEYLLSQNYIRSTFYENNEGKYDTYQNVITYKKTFAKEGVAICTISVEFHTNYYGGKTTIEVIPFTSMSKEVAPSLCFHATGMKDFPTFEKKILEEILPQLLEWKIKTL